MKNSFHTCTLESEKTNKSSVANSLKLLVKPFLSLEFVMGRIPRGVTLIWLQCWNWKMKNGNRVWKRRLLEEDGKGVVRG